jgi:ribulose kinase
MAIVAGIDFGTLSVRVTLLDSDRGRLGTSVTDYPAYANVLNKPVLVPDGTATSLGSGIVALTAPGVFPSIEAAQQKLCLPFRTFIPEPKASGTSCSTSSIASCTSHLDRAILMPPRLGICCRSFVISRINQKRKNKEPHPCR